MKIFCVFLIFTCTAILCHALPEEYGLGQHKTWKVTTSCGISSTLMYLHRHEVAEPTVSELAEQYGGYSTPVAFSVIRDYINTHGLKTKIYEAETIGKKNFMGIVVVKSTGVAPKYKHFVYTERFKGKFYLYDPTVSLEPKVMGDEEFYKIYEGYYLK